MTKGSWLSDDRHFCAIAVSRWDNEGGAPKRNQQNETTNGKVPFDLASEAASPGDLFHIGRSVNAGHGLSETYDRKRS
jgi:hypothetical protein